MIHVYTAMVENNLDQGLLASEFGTEIGFPMWTGMFEDDQVIGNDGTVVTNVVKLVISADNPM